MTILSWRRSVGAVLLCGACTTSSNGNSEADGTGHVEDALHHQPFVIEDAVSAAVATTVDGVTAHAATIAMANTSDLCGDAMMNVSHPNENGVLIALSDVNGPYLTTPTAPGSYTISQAAPSTKTAVLQLYVTDVACGHIAVAATTGTVTLTAVRGDRFTGTFAVVFDNGAQLTGSFTPSECPALAMPSAAPSSCR